MKVSTVLPASKQLSNYRLFSIIGFHGAEPLC